MRDDLVPEYQENAERLLRDKVYAAAKRQGLIATKSRKDGKWYIADQSGLLLSDEIGMDVEEAHDWLMLEQASEE